MVKVFVSYSDDDGRDLAEKLRKALEGFDNDISAFVAAEDIDIGVSWEPEIINALNDCDVFIPILTIAACRSNWVRKEIEIAIEKEKRCIPCVYNQVLPDLIPDIIEGLQRITFKSGYDLTRQVLARFIPPEILARQTQIAIDSSNVGIDRIFKNRRFSPELDGVLKRQIANAKEDILILGNALWSFFGEDERDKKVIYKDAVEKALNNETNFKVILLDPLSEAAKERAIIEHGPLVEEDVVYLNSDLFKDISRVTNWLYNPPAQLEDEIKDHVEVRYSTMAPIAFIVKTDTHTFIEQYHLGSLDAIRSKQTYRAVCLGGYVPFFMVDNNQPWAKLMQSHFWTIWNKMETNSLQEVYSNIERFERDPKEYRASQVLNYIKERGRLDAIFRPK